MTSPFSLENEVALITGGGSGIGLGIARCMVQAGAQVVLVGRREEQLAHAGTQLGAQAHYLVHDITQLNEASALVDRAAKSAGHSVTILVNNAGNHFKKKAIDTTPEDFGSVLNTHVLAAHALTRAALPDMLRQRHGSILFTASMTSFFGIPQVIAYAAAKSAYLGMVRTLTTEVSPHGVRVNAIAPGWIESDITRNALDADPERKSKVLGRTPMGRLGQADDIGWAAVYLCSTAAQFVTGTILPVDGGANIGF